MKAADLRTLLKGRGLLATGKREELVKRLLAHDRVISGNDENEEEQGDGEKKKEEARDGNVDMEERAQNDRAVDHQAMECIFS